MSSRMGSWGRGFVALGALMAWASLGRITRTNGLPYAPFGLDALPMNAAIAACVSIIFLLALLAFLTRRADLGAAVVVALLAAGTKAVEWQAAPGMGVNNATTLPGAALFAWWVARRTSGAPDERTARGVEAACGVVAACYGLAVASKLYTSGLAWAGSGNIGLQIATQAWLAPEPVRELRLAAAGTPWLCGALGTATLLIEGGALLFVLPAARLPLAGLILAMHLGIAALMGLHHYDWMFTAIGWALVSASGGVPVPSNAVPITPDLSPPRLQPR